MWVFLRKRAGLFGLGLGLCLVSPVAEAQSSANNKAASEALFQEGKALLEQGEYERACAKFAASQELDAGFGTLMNLGDCFEKRKMTASAWATFKEAVSTARVQGNAEREAAARDRAAALEARLSKLVIRISGEIAALDGLEVRLNDTPLPKAVWGSSVPVDPGTLRVEVGAPGYRAFKREIRVTDAAESVLDVPPLEREATSAQTPSPLAPAQANSDASSSTSYGAQRTLGFVIGGAGVVGLAVGSVFGLRAFSKNGQSEDDCEGGFCNDRGLSLREEAKDAAGVSTIAFAAGGFLAAGGLVLIFTAPRRKPAAGTLLTPRRSLGVAPFVARGTAGLGLGGSF